MIETFHKSQLPELKQWWDIGVAFVESPTECWSEYVRGNENVHCFCSSHNGRIAVYSQTDVEDGIGFMAIVTNPLLLRSGHATTHLREAEKRLATIGVRNLIAAVETDNLPSIEFFQKNGYHLREDGESEPGFLDYEKNIQELASIGSCKPDLTQDIGKEKR